jgi:hypothetical protein
VFLLLCVYVFGDGLGIFLFSVAIATAEGSRIKR